MSSGNIYIDFETYSPYDLKKCGMAKYMEKVDPLVCVIMKDVSDDAMVWRCDRCDMQSLLYMLTDAVNYHIVAHNAHFEKYVIENVLNMELPASLFTCTMAMCAQLSLPRSLDGVSKALGLGAKLTDGKTLIRKFTKPRKLSLHNKDVRNHPEKFPDDFDTFVDYCKMDVRLNRELYHTLKGYLS